MELTGCGCGSGCGGSGSVTGGIGAGDGAGFANGGLSSVGSSNTVHNPVENLWRSCAKPGRARGATDGWQRYLPSWNRRSSSFSCCSRNISRTRLRTRDCDRTETRFPLTCRKCARGRPSRSEDCSGTGDARQQPLPNEGRALRYEVAKNRRRDAMGARRRSACKGLMAE